MLTLLSLEHAQFCTESTHSSKGTLCDTAGSRAPSASPLADVEGLLLQKGRALLSSEALLGSEWETLME